MSTHAPHLLAPLRLGDLQLPHRLLMGSMHTGLDVVGDDGEALAAFYGERARGGAGLIVTGGIAVNEAGRAGPDYGVLTRAADSRAWGRAVAEVHAGGALIAAQLFHAGRYADPRGLVGSDGVVPATLAPSPVAWRAAGGAVPHAMTDAQVRETIADFAATASRAVELGFDAVEIMASEGYLINQFCSPLTNQRDDDWGGDDVARRRFALAVLRAVRAAVPAGFPVLVRVSGDDLMPGGTTREQAVALAVDLAAAGADALNVGVGWHESRVPTVQAHVPAVAWLAVAEGIAGALRAAGLDTPVVASNRISTLAQAEAVLARGVVDAVALARPFLADARFVARSLAGHEPTPCIACDQACIDRSLFSRPVSCLVNPRAGREALFPLPMGSGAGSGRVAPVADDGTAPVLVVGAGPAGLAAALDLARRGVPVELHDARDHLGGQFALAARVPGKQDYGAFVSSALAELAEAGAGVFLGSRVAADDDGMVRASDGRVPRAVVLATGVRPRALPLPWRGDGGAGVAGSGIVVGGGTVPDGEVPGAPRVLTYEEALRGPRPAGPVVVVGGGGIGTDVALWLTEPAGAAARARSFYDAHMLRDLAGARAGLEELAPAALEGAAEIAGTPLDGAEVTVVGRARRFAAGVGVSTRWVVLSLLRAAGVAMLGEHDAIALAPGGVWVQGVVGSDSEGTERFLPAATVIVCVGQVPHEPLSAVLAGAGVPFEIVGGAGDASGLDAVRATTQGLEAARRLVPTGRATADER